MSGVDIIGELLRDDPDKAADIATANIKTGVLPPDVSLPALLVAEISQVERQTLKRLGVVRTIDRVRVTGRFTSVRERKAIMDWVKARCAGRTGTIASFSNVSILTAGRGPDLNGPGSSFEKSQDFKVSYDATT